MAKKKKQSSNQLEIQNAAKTLLANIRFMAVDSPIKSIVVTSSVPNEGKSTVSVNLAQAIATAGKRVLLVEADMRRRSLAAMLNVRSAAGLYAVLTDAVPLDVAVASTTTANLFFLDTEPNIPNPADMIASKRFGRLVRLLEERYDYVIFDMPPRGDVRRCGYPVHARGRDHHGSASESGEANRARGSLRAAAEGECQRRWRVCDVRGGLGVRVLLRLLHELGRAREARGRARIRCACRRQKCSEERLARDRDEATGLPCPAAPAGGCRLGAAAGVQAIAYARHPLPHTSGR